MSKIQRVLTIAPQRSIVLSDIARPSALGYERSTIKPLETFIRRPTSRYYFSTSDSKDVTPKTVRIEDVDYSPRVYKDVALRFLNDGAPFNFKNDDLGLLCEVIVQRIVAPKMGQNGASRIYSEIIAQREKTLQRIEHLNEILVDHKRKHKIFGSIALTASAFFVPYVLGMFPAVYMSVGAMAATYLIPTIAGIALLGYGVTQIYKKVSRFIRLADGGPRGAKKELAIKIKLAERYIEILGREVRRISKAGDSEENKEKLDTAQHALGVFIQIRDSLKSDRKGPKVPKLDQMDSGLDLADFLLLSISPRLAYARRIKAYEDFFRDLEKRVGKLIDDIQRANIPKEVKDRYSGLTYNLYERGQELEYEFADIFNTGSSNAVQDANRVIQKSPLLGAFSLFNIKSRRIEEIIGKMDILLSDQMNYLYFLTKKPPLDLVDVFIEGPKQPPPDLALAIAFRLIESRQSSEEFLNKLIKGLRLTSEALNGHLTEQCVDAQADIAKLIEELSPLVGDQSSLKKYHTGIESRFTEDMEHALQVAEKIYGSMLFIREKIKQVEDPETTSSNPGEE